MAGRQEGRQCHNLVVVSGMKVCSGGVKVETAGSRYKALYVAGQAAAGCPSGNQQGMKEAEPVAKGVGWCGGGI